MVIDFHLISNKGSSLIGRISLGYLSDKLNPWSLALCILFPSSLATFIIWGLLSKNLTGLICFGIAYGCLAGSWTSLWSGFIKPVASKSLNRPSRNTYGNSH